MHFRRGVTKILLLNSYYMSVRLSVFENQKICTLISVEFGVLEFLVKLFHISVLGRVKQVTMYMCT